MTRGLPPHTTIGTSSLDRSVDVGLPSNAARISLIDEAGKGGSGQLAVSGTQKNGDPKTPVFPVLTAAV